MKHITVFSEFIMSKRIAVGNIHRHLKSIYRLHWQ